MRKLLLVVLSTFALSACSTIVFEKEGASLSGSVVKKWHHNWVFDLYEGSAPANISRLCEGKGWEQVQIEESFWNALLVGFISAPIWYPDTVTVTCENGAAK